MNRLTAPAPTTSRPAVAGATAGRPSRALLPETLAGRLTRTLILWVTGVWLIGVLSVTWFVDREINFNFDNELVEVSHRMFDLAIDQFESQQGSATDDRMVIAPTPSFADAAVYFQLVQPDERVLMRSAETPPNVFDVPLAPGFANDEQWRIYTVRHPSRKLYLQVADPLAERRRALDRTLIGLLLPLGALLPMLAWVLRRTAREELRVLENLSAEIAERDGSDLRPIALPGLTRELQTVGEHMNRLLKRLGHALDVERALAANAAHELRTPLAAARLRLQTALDHGLERSDVEAGLDALRTLAARTEKLLQLSRAESGAALTHAGVEPGRIAAAVAEDFWQDPLIARRLTLVLPGTYDDDASRDDPVGPIDPPVTVVGDFDSLAIALRNLIENALRYGGDDPVQLEVLANGDLLVRDAGPGVDAEHLDRMRERHVRQSALHAGYGLGLSIVGTIVARHGAQLVLTSPPTGQRSGFEARIAFGQA